MAHQHDVERLRAEAEQAQADLTRAKRRLTESRHRCWIAYTMMLGAALTVVSKLALNDTVRQRASCVLVSTPQWLWVTSGFGLGCVLAAAGWSAIRIAAGHRGRGDSWLHGTAFACLIMIGWVNYTMWQAQQTLSLPGCLIVW